MPVIVNAGIGELTSSLQIVSKIFRPNDGYPVSTAITENVDFEECHTFKS